MSALPTELSSDTASLVQAPNEILRRQWPSLSRAMSSYQQNTAEAFSRMAYDKVEAGLIRLDDRRELAAAASRIGIRDFDAQLLIACAVRKWSLDRRYDPAPSNHAPVLSYEYRAWKRAWVRVALILGTAAALDSIILWKWLS